MKQDLHSTHKTSSLRTPPHPVAKKDAMVHVNVTLSPVTGSGGVLYRRLPLGGAFGAEIGVCTDGEDIGSFFLIVTQELADEIL